MNALLNLLSAGNKPKIVLQDILFYILAICLFIALVIIFSIFVNSKKYTEKRPIKKPYIYSHKTFKWHIIRDDEE